MRVRNNKKVRIFLIALSLIYASISLCCRSTAVEELKNDLGFEKSVKSERLKEIEIDKDDFIFALFQNDLFENQLAKNFNSENLLAENFNNEKFVEENFNNEKIVAENFQQNNLQDEKFIFIRLYKPYYDNPFCVENILSGAIKSVDVNKEKFTHCAINFDLNDSFYGLTTAGEQDLKIESCSDVLSNPYMKKCNDKKSIQVTYALKVSEEEYDKVKSRVEEYYFNPNVKYNVLQNFAVGQSGINRLNYSKAERKFGCHSNLHFERTFEEGKTDFVCSSFVAYVLANSVESVKNFFIEHKINSDYVFPSDLAYIPGVTKLFCSTWVDYEIAAQTYTKMYPSLALYYMEDSTSKIVDSVLTEDINSDVD